MGQEGTEPSVEVAPAVQAVPRPVHLSVTAPATCWEGGSNGAKRWSNGGQRSVVPSPGPVFPSAPQTPGREGGSNGVKRWSNGGQTVVWDERGGSKGESCVCARARACVCVCVCACVRACVVKQGGRATFEEEGGSLWSNIMVKSATPPLPSLRKREDDHPLPSSLRGREAWEGGVVKQNGQTLACIANLTSRIDHGCRLLTERYSHQSVFKTIDLTTGGRRRRHPRPGGPAVLPGQRG